MSDAREHRKAKGFVLHGECEVCRSQFGIMVTWFGLEPRDEDLRLIPIHKEPTDGFAYNHSYRLALRGFGRD